MLRFTYHGYSCADAPLIGTGYRSGWSDFTSAFRWTSDALYRWDTFPIPFPSPQNALRVGPMAASALMNAMIGAARNAGAWELAKARPEC